MKKAYRKATLYVHPDKLQQRGASIQQKYICEKIFDLLKVMFLQLRVLISVATLFFLLFYVLESHYFPFCEPKAAWNRFNSEER